MWGMHLVLDVEGSEGSKSLVRSKQNIETFIKKLVPAIEMKAYGEPLIVHFAEHIEDAAGYSLVQLIETSSITGHFCDVSGDIYLDVFSCKEFDVEIVFEMVRKYFKPKEIRSALLARQAGG